MKSFSALLVAAGIALGLGAPASAQDYPTRPVKVVIAFLARRRHRHPRPLDRRQAQPACGASSVFVENRPGGSGNIGAAAASHRRARRLHAALRRADARRQRDAVADHGVRSGHELRSDHAGRDLPGGVPGLGRDAVQIGAGRDRLRQGQPGQAELLLGRHRLDVASVDRAVHGRHRHQDAARALQPDGAGHDRPD